MSPTTMNFQFFFSTAMTLKITVGQVHQNLISSLFCPNYISLIGKNPTIGSQDIVQTRK